MLGYDTDKTWFSHLLRHLAIKQRGSIYTTPEPTWSRTPWNFVAKVYLHHVKV